MAQEEGRTHMDWQLLVVDDEADVCKTLEKYLTFEGFKVMTATSGAAAMDLVKTRKIHIALIDIKMPGMTGIELLRRMKDVDYSIQVIIMTGYSTFDLAFQAFEAGAADYILKPFDEMSKIVQLITLSMDRLERWHKILAQTIRQQKPAE